MGVCFLGNQCRLKSSSSILRNSQVVLQGTEQVARSQSEKPLTFSEGSVTEVAIIATRCLNCYSCLAFSIKK